VMDQGVHSRIKQITRRPSYDTIRMSKKAKKGEQGIISCESDGRKNRKPWQPKAYLCDGMRILEQLENTGDRGGREWQSKIGGKSPKRATSDENRNIKLLTASHKVPRFSNVGRAGRPRTDLHRVVRGIVYLLATGNTWRTLTREFGARRSTIIFWNGLMGVFSNVISLIIPYHLQ